MKFVPKAVSRSVGRNVLLAQKHMPKSMFSVGIVGVVIGTVFACKATLKVEKVLDDIKDEVEMLKEPSISLTQKEYNKNMARIYAKGSFELLKLYGPAIAITAASIAALSTSHIALTRRNASLTAAYSALTLSFNEYRERVKKEVGEKRELELYNGFEFTVDKEGIKVKEGGLPKTGHGSPYARWFEESNQNWTKNPELNRLFILANQEYLNVMLKTRGHVFLNEAYDQLGLERSQAGSVVGWIYGPDGDNFIDFGLYEESAAPFINGLERNVFLDFNVDGVIYDKI